MKWLGSCSLWVACWVAFLRPKWLPGGLGTGLSIGEDRLCASLCQPSWGHARFGRASALAASEGASPRVDLTAYPQSCCAAPPCLSHARDRWGRVHSDGHRAPGTWAGYSPLRARHRVRCLFLCDGNAVLGAGRWAHRHGGLWGTILVSGTLENKERKIPKTKGALGRTRG